MSDILHLGFYCGLAMLYPYGPVYCDNADCLHGSCYGVYIYTSKSAPLPAKDNACVAAGDANAPGFYIWKPRKVRGERLCFLSDKSTSPLPEPQIGNALRKAQP